MSSQNSDEIEKSRAEKKQKSEKEKGSVEGTCISLEEYKVRYVSLYFFT